MKSKKKKLGGNDTRFAYALLAPSLILLVLLIGYPMIYNIVISFQDVPINPRMASEFVGLDNFKGSSWVIVGKNYPQTQYLC